MATTQSQPSLNVAASGDRALDFFDAQIWHDPLICSECFARLKTTATDEVDDWGTETTQTWRTDDAMLAQDVIAKAEIGERTVRHPDGTVTGTEPVERSTATYAVRPRTTCLECGSVGGRAHSETISTETAVERADRLVSRLDEQGFAIDADTVFDTVRRLKSRPEYDGRIRDMFATAAALGVDRA